MRTELVANVDLDGTLANYNAAMLAALDELRSPDEPRVTSIEEAPAWLERRMGVIKRVPGFWRSLARIEDGFKVLDEIVRAGFRINVLTKGPKRTTSAWTEKVEWCAANMPPDTQVTITQDKGLVYGRVLFDDWPPYVNGWLAHRPRGLVIMLDHPWNSGFSHPNVVKVARSADPGHGESMDRVRAALREAACR